MGVKKIQERHCGRGLLLQGSCSSMPQGQCGVWVEESLGWSCSGCDAV